MRHRAERSKEKLQAKLTLLAHQTRLRVVAYANKTWRMEELLRCRIVVVSSQILEFKQSAAQGSHPSGRNDSPCPRPSLLLPACHDGLSRQAIHLPVCTTRLKMACSTCLHGKIWTAFVHVAAPSLWNMYYSHVASYLALMLCSTTARLRTLPPSRVPAPLGVCPRRTSAYMYFLFLHVCLS